jgi:hypothetical protein
MILLAQIFHIGDSAVAIGWCNNTCFPYTLQLINQSIQLLFSSSNFHKRILE